MNFWEQLQYVTEEYDKKYGDYPENMNEGYAVFKFYIDNKERLDKAMGL